MRRVVPLLVALTRDWLRNREAVFFAFMFPVVLLLIFSAVFGGGGAEFTLYVQNNDLDASGEPTNLSATFVDALNETEALSARSSWRFGPRRGTTSDGPVAVTLRPRISLL